MTPVEPQKQRVKLLLVDDSPENLLALEAVLESLDQILVKATSGIEALRYLLEDDFAAILLDVRMPDMDGFEAAEMIRSRKRSQNTPILFLTGYRSDEHLSRGYGIGAVDFLFKPLVPAILKSKVAVFVELSLNAALLKQQAEELQRTEKKFRAVLEAAPEAMVITDEAGAITLVNSQTEELFGYSREQLLGRNVQTLLPGWDLSNRGRAQELEAVTSSKRSFPAEISVKTSRTDEGGVLISVIRDVTARRQYDESIRRLNADLERKVAERTHELLNDIAERRRVEQALRESEQRLRVAIEAAHMGMWSVDAASGRLNVSARVAEALGWEDADASADLQRWRESVHPEDREAAEGELTAALSGSRDYESEYRVLHGGRVGWLSVRGQMLRDANGAPFRLVGVAQDITERKQAEEATHHRAKLESLGILAGGIAHDFNNLLTGILGNASMMLDDTPENTPEFSMLTDLVNSADRAAQLTKQMLAYSGKGHFVVKPISLSQQVREIMPLIAASIPKQAQVKLALDDEMPLVEADPSQLQQLVMNLILNAAEAIDRPGGTVRVSTQLENVPAERTDFYLAEPLAPGKYVVLVVEDTGHGMDAETMARIFDPFFTTKFTGRGLGLAAALGIVRGHKGGIHVDSEPGRGTCFRVYFPALASAQLTQPSGSVAHDLTGAGTVLIVDDEEVVRRLAKVSLERQGYRVLLAHGGEEAIKMVNGGSEPVKLVVLDMAMPDMNGDDVLRELRRRHPLLRVIASSGFSESEARKRFGPDIRGFLQKPYTVSQLAALVKSAAAE